MFCRDGQADGWAVGFSCRFKSFNLEFLNPLCEICLICFFSHEVIRFPMLAQRWEKPSTAQEERQTILRARKLCEETSGRTTSRVAKRAPGISPSLDLDSNPGPRYYRDSTTFLFISWIFGVQPNLVAQIFESIPTSLMNAAAFLEDTLCLVQKQLPQAQLDASNSSLKPQPNDHMSLKCRWNPDTMKRTCVEASPEFCRSIAGMDSMEFYQRMESNKFPLPCNPAQYLFYFLDGALCMGEGLTSWTRSVITLLAFYPQRQTD